MIALKQRDRVDIRFHTARMAGHQQLHKLLGVAVALRALDDDFLDILVVEVANSAFDQVTVLIDERRRCRPQRFVANFVPKTREIIEVAANLDFRALQACRPHDAAHRARQVQFGHDDLQPLSVSCV